MKKRYLILGNFLIVFIIVLVSLLGYRQLKFDFISKSEKYLETVSTYVDLALDESGLETTEMNSTIDNSIAVFNSFDSSLRITILNDLGEVIADSDYTLDMLNNHRNRKEVYAIISDASSYSTIRYSATEQINRLYYAMDSDNHDAIIRATINLNYLDSARTDFIVRGLIIGLLILSFFNVIVYLFKKKIDRYLSDYSQTLKDIKNGNLAARVKIDRYSYPKLQEISEVFNSTTDILEQNIKELHAGRTSLDTMVNSLMEPLVLVNRELQVVFSNKFARKLFNRDIDPELNPYPFILLTHEVELDDLCEQVMKTGKTARGEFVLQVTGSYRAFQVTISLVDEQNVVVLFNDISLEYEARKLRSSFVANVTHELKTPLTSIRGFVETLRNHENTKPEQVDNFLEIIDVEAARLERLINDILKLSDIEHHNTDSDMEDFDLVELVDECVVQLDDQATKKKINLIPNDEPTFLPVKANRDRIKQVILNLLENAIKYHRRKGSVWLAVERSEEYVTIKVKDDGYGLDDQSAKRVFERFYRVDESRSRMLGGTGLGLSIVKHIALLYEGEATVESTPNIGSTFTVNLKI